MADDAAAAGDDPKLEKKQRRGLLSRLWRWLFGSRTDDYEKRLQYLSKEEAVVLSRMKRRDHKSKKMIRNVILLAFSLEIVAVGYAIIMTKGVDLSRQMRAARVLPMFVVPAMGFALYRGIVSLARMLDQKDQKTLERLRSERKAKIDELKEQTNYYLTQQLIQRYDLDPAAKAAAATVLASKLGEDSGLKVTLGDETNPNTPLGKTSDVELVQSTGLRSRRPSLSRTHSAGSPQFADEANNELGAKNKEAAALNQKMVEHYRGPPPDDGNLLTRLVAFLVGDDPAHSYALICGNCRMHNGLARKEDFPYMRYYCPHCHALNGPLQPEGSDSGLSSGRMTPRSSSNGSSVSGVSTLSSISGSDVGTNLATVQELPVDTSDEKEA